MISFGLDTGSKRVGWAVLEGGDGEMVHKASGVIRLNENLRHPYRMLRFERALMDLFSLYRPTNVTIEELSSVRNAKVARILQGYITVAVLSSVRHLGVEPNLLTIQTIMARIGVRAMSPQEKKRIGGTKAQRSKEISQIGKRRIRTVVNALFGLDLGEAEQDRADAVAVALAGLGG